MSESDGMRGFDLVVYSGIMSMAAIPMATAMLVVTGTVMIGTDRLSQRVFGSKSSTVPTIIFAITGLAISVIFITTGVLIMKRFSKMSQSEQKDRWVLNPTASALMFSGVLMLFLIGMYTVICIRDGNIQKKTSDFRVNGNGNHGNSGKRGNVGKK